MRNQGHRILSFALTLLAIELFAIPTGQAAWLTSGPLTIARYDHTATLLPDGKVLVAGGGYNFGFFSSAEIYDPAKGTWTATGSMADNRALHTATLLPNGMVLIAAGLSSEQIFNHPNDGAELYDPATGRWRATSPMAFARYYHTATLLPNGKVLVAAGSVSSSELYDPATEQWALVGPMTAPHSQHTATLLANGKVLVAGGVDMANAELYDPTSGTWTATGSMASPRRLFTATLLPDGKVLVAGGIAAGYTAVSSAELYDPATGTWTPANAMAAARFAHTATLLPTGKVLIAGGAGTGWLASSELYDPRTGRWESADTMSMARSEHTATLLPNGRVLVAGGRNQIGNSVEAVSGTDLYGKAKGTVTLSNLVQTYDGTPKAVLFATAPAGLEVDVTYNGSSEAPINVGNYTVIAIIKDPNYAGGTTNILLVGAQPVILSQPASRTNNLGTVATFEVVADGTPPFFYQWRRNGTNSSAVNGPILTLTNVQKFDEGFYSVAVSNAFGFASSADARLTVNRPPIADASATKPVVISPNGTNASVVLNGSRSSDPDGNLLVYSWYEAGNPAPLAHSSTAVVDLPLGVHFVLLVVSDGLSTGTNRLTVEVITITEAVRRLMQTVATSAPHPFLVTLSAATDAIQRGNNLAALGQLRAFQNKVFAEEPSLDAATRLKFIQGAQEIIDALSNATANHQHQPRRIESLYLQNDGRVHIQFSATPGAISLIQASTNMLDWETIGVAGEGASNSVSFEDQNPPKYMGRFYRIVSP